MGEMNSGLSSLIPTFIEERITLAKNLEKEAFGKMSKIAWALPLFLVILLYPISAPFPPSFPLGRPSAIAQLCLWLVGEMHL